MATDEYLTLQEIASRLRISQETARRAVLDGRMEGMQVRGPNSTWRVDRRSFREYLDKAHKGADATVSAAGGNQDQKNG